MGLLVPSLMDLSTTSKPMPTSFMLMESPGMAPAYHLTLSLVIRHHREIQHFFRRFNASIQIPS